ncbi:MAG: hypothetical protein NTZ34_11410 [Chloroflexi bacterium]|nr:hypothetical protein [Chloroflexota bacterium]
MSKLIDKLNNLNKTDLPAMGFRKADPEEKRASMLVLAEISGKPEDEIKEIANSGIAGVIIDSAGLTAAALSRCLKNTNNLAAGISLPGSKTGSSFKLISDGIDFIVFDVKLPMAAFEGKEIKDTGKILSVDAGIEAGLLRSVHDVYPGIDAVMIDLRISTLTMENMLSCRRVSDFSGQHTVALVNKSLTATELMALRNAGVKALVLPQDTTVEEMKSVVDAVSALPRQDRKKGKKAVALIPQLGMAPAPKEEDEGDGDGDGE